MLCFPVSIRVSASEDYRLPAAPVSGRAPDSGDCADDGALPPSPLLPPPYPVAMTSPRAPLAAQLWLGAIVAGAPPILCLGACMAFWAHTLLRSARAMGHRCPAAWSSHRWQKPPSCRFWRMVPPRARLPPLPPSLLWVQTGSMGWTWSPRTRPPLLACRLAAIGWLTHCLSPCPSPRLLAHPLRPLCMARALLPLPTRCPAVPSLP